MLKDEGYTIEGAKKQLKQGRKEDFVPEPLEEYPVMQVLQTKSEVQVNNFELINRLKLIRDGLESLKVKVHIRF
jgi:hypothetical protein